MQQGKAFAEQEYPRLLIFFGMAEFSAGRCAYLALVERVATASSAEDALHILADAESMPSSSNHLPLLLAARLPILVWLLGETCSVANGAQEQLGQFEEVYISSMRLLDLTPHPPSQVAAMCKLCSLGLVQVYHHIAVSVVTTPSCTDTAWRA